MVEISIVIPVYNSEDCLLELNKEMEQAFSGFGPYQLILVNDKSRDKSWERIIEICRMNKNAVGVCLRKNFGQDNALLAGLRMATGKYVVIMDDDLQHAPKDIFKLYNKCKEGCDVCYAEFPRKYQAFWKNFGSWMNGKLAEKLLSKPPEVYMSPFKILRGDLVSELVKFLGAYPYVDATILTITSNFSQVPVEHHKRFRGKSNYHLIPSMSVFIKHATSYSVYPLRLASYTGFGCATAAFLLGCFYLIDYLFFGDHVEGWTTIVLLNIFFGGVILMSLGIVGEYIGRMYLCVNGKPQYSIEKVVRNQQAEPEVTDTATGAKAYAA